MNDKMTVISMPTIPETIYPLLKHDEEIICENAIVTLDSRGEITWWDRNKPINIICENKEDK